MSIWISLMSLTVCLPRCRSTISSPPVCRAFSCWRDSALFITRFINLNANWFCEGGLSERWGPSPVFSHWLCVSVCFVHLLDPAVTRPDRTASPACLSRLKCGTDTVWVLQARETSTTAQRKQTRLRGFRFRSSGGENTSRKTMWIKAVGTLYVAAWIKQEDAGGGRREGGGGS